MPRGLAADRDTAVRTVTPTRTASRQMMNGFVEINTFIHSAPKQKSDEWMHLSPLYTRMHGEWLRYAKSTSQYSLAFSLKVRDDWGFQVNPLCRHDITHSDRQIGNHGSLNRERDTASSRRCAMLRTQASDEEVDDVFSRHPFILWSRR